MPFFADAPVVHLLLPAREEPLNATVLFAGDMMFDRTIRAAMAEKGSDHVFSCIAPELRDADLVVANLEGPVTTHDSMSLGSEIGSLENMTFTFPTTTAHLLARYNIRVVSLANNHIMNFGDDGLMQTKRWLAEAGVQYFGAPDDVDRTARVDIKGIPFSFIGWSDWDSTTKDETLAQIRTERALGRIVVVFAHWGEEYEPPPERVRALGRHFVDAGATLVVGAHPHIVQEHEVYNGTYIFYSLGNFVFDQYWNEDVRTGLLVRATFNKYGVTAIDSLPIELGRDRRTCLKEIE